MSAAVQPLWPWDESIRLTGGRIPTEQAQRQERTARAVLERLATRPGLVLADEVGMGKTFVALAVAASAAFASDQPVVVMVPPRLIDKWESDAHKFRKACLSPRAGATEAVFRVRRAETGAELLKCFDDPPERRAHLVLLANTALHKAERDPFVRLAAMRLAIERGGLDVRRRRAIARNARQLLRSSDLAGLGEDAFEALLEAPCEAWISVLRDHAVEVDDDPVPKPFLDVLGTMDLSALSEALNKVPKFDSVHFDERIQRARGALNESLRSLWKTTLHSTSIRSPLLVFDEAHHLKNPDTRLGSLFLAPEAGDTSVISDAFDRMLFLTATPFQLGHRELIEVLRRFRAVRKAALPPGVTLDTVKAELEALEEALDRAQTEGLELDRAWGDLSAEELGWAPGAEPPSGWWDEMLARHPEGASSADSGAAVVAARRSADAPPEVTNAAVRRVVEQFRSTSKAMRRAEEELRPWVLRHLRSRVLKAGDVPVPRRVELRGRAIVDDVHDGGGLRIDPEARMPFLLCARAQSLLASEPGRRAYFAEGLSSSYGAFLRTHEGGPDARPVDDADTGLAEGTDSSTLAWYLASVKEFVDSASVSHPKIEATARRVVSLWEQGEKVLVFGHFRMTIRALRDRIGELVEQSIGTMAARALRLPATETEEAKDRVRRIVQRLQDRDSPLRLAVEQNLARWVEPIQELTPVQRASVVELLLKTLATPSFVVRNFPLDREEVRASLETERPTTDKARAAADAVAQSLARRRGDRLEFRPRVEAFLRYLTGTFSTTEERDRILAELASADPDVVRHASGEVKDEQRKRVLLGFNSPMLPEILVASEVMAEGLDLHLDCRHVIHHDLSWNPSTLEQRTGRIDRLGCLAENELQPIQIYLPYLEGTADEKMYRVVMDRARWFQVVMGETYSVDEQSTEKLARRVPFPAEAATALTFDLSVAEADPGESRRSPER